MTNKYIVSLFFFDDSKLEMERQDKFLLSKDLYKIMKDIAECYNAHTCDKLQVWPFDENELDSNLLSNLSLVETMDQLKSKLDEPDYDCLLNTLDEKNTYLYQAIVKQ